MSKLQVVVLQVVIVMITLTWVPHAYPEPSDTKNGEEKPNFAGQYPFVGTAEVIHTGLIRCLCVVTAVTPDWLLTVLSCFNDIIRDGDDLTIEMLNNAGVKVRLPNFDLEKGDLGENMKSFTQVILGPNIGDERPVLARVDNPISKQLTSKVKVASGEVGDGRECVSVGWIPTHYIGTDIARTDSKLKDIAQKISLNMSNNTQIPDIMRENLVWAKTISTDTSPDICKFEIGSPLLCKDGAVWNLMGVAGNLGDDFPGSNCSTSDNYVPYILLKPHVKWMYSQIRQEADKNGGT